MAPRPTGRPEPEPVKGAGRCPKCASRRTIRSKCDDPRVTNFYSATLEICPNCKAIWEPFDPAQLLDPHIPTTSSFKEPCDNCAFRPGSVEQSDPKRWAELMADLKKHGSFHCHKGVPIDPDNENGFAYPTDRKKLRLCRGWLKMWGARMDREYGVRP